jgi:tRNA pseudouridine55 synthase
LEKEYTGTMMLGATTPSFDMETQINERYSIAHITPELINETAKKFVGSIWQYPPNFSAKWVQGDRAYNIARSGGQPDIKPVLVNITKFEIVSVLLPMIEFKVVCAKGTYIRSLANDFGKQLGCGALLASLNRTRIGNYKLKDAKEIKDWMEAVQPSVPKKRIPPKTAAKKAAARQIERKQLSAPSKPTPKKKLAPKKKVSVKKKNKGKKKK